MPGFVVYWSEKAGCWHFRSEWVERMRHPQSAGYRTEKEAAQAARRIFAANAKQNKR